MKQISVYMVWLIAASMDHFEYTQHSLLPSTNYRDASFFGNIPLPMMTTVNQIRKDVVMRPISELAISLKLIGIY